MSSTPASSDTDTTGAGRGNRSPARFLWLGLVVLLPMTLFWANRQAGGIVPAEVSCAFAAAKIGAPAADVILFGSSRTGTALDPHAIEGVLNARPGADPLRIDRLNITGADALASASMLERYIETRGVPRVVVSEVMLSLKHRKRIPRRGLYGSRHFSILPYDQLMRYRDVVYGDTEPGRKFHIYLNFIYARTVALIHGLVRNPLGKHWFLEDCDEGDRSRDGVWALAEKSVFLPPQQQIAAEESLLAGLPRVTDNTDWIWGADGPEIAAYDVHAKDRYPNIAMMRYMVELAAEHDIQVVFLPLINYASSVAPADREFFESMGENVHWMDLYAAAGDILEANWRDPLHVHTRASTLLSAHLAGSLIPLLEQ